jgi:flavin-binding protein dodecin
VTLDHFASLITGTGTAATAPDLSDSISTLSPEAFDPRNRYTSIFRAVRNAVAAAAPSSIDVDGIDVKVYRVQLDASRVEYWIITLDVERGQIVGLKAKAVES